MFVNAFDGVPRLDLHQSVGDAGMLPRGHGDDVADHVGHPDQLDGEASGRAARLDHPISDPLSDILYSWK